MPTSPPEVTRAGERRAPHSQRNLCCLLSFFRMTWRTYQRGNLTVAVWPVSWDEVRRDTRRVFEPGNRCQHQARHLNMEWDCDHVEGHCREHRKGARGDHGLHHEGHAR